ncbi:hypothetical protein [Olivibacter sitiensis]|uniref:hypothetical protein n=1 Tax=Olivibacter sitiensis TaxID=376470 RepID=UPI0004875985|nr:hypothetical protein [Olivibacter sitiensis]
MKKTLLFVFVLSYTLGSYAQVRRIDTLTFENTYLPRQQQSTSPSDFMYSIAVRAFALEQFPQLLNQPVPGDLFASYLNGLMFKFNDNQFSYRLYASYFDKKNVNLDNVDNDLSKRANGHLKNLALKIGFEKNLTYTKLQPYFGFDIGYMRQHFDGNTQLMLAGAPDSNDFEENTIDRKNTALLSGFIGIKLNITSQFTLLAEANANTTYSFQKTDVSSENSEGFQFQQKQKEKWEYFFSPIGQIGIQFNFGSIN